MFLETFFNIESIRYTFPLLLEGFILTVQLVAVVVPLGILLGTILAFVYALGGPVTKGLFILFVDMFRSLPPLVLLVFIFYGLPFLGLQLGSFFAAVLALVLNGSSYYAEIVRGGIANIPKGQWDAGRATGLTRLQTNAYIVLPQAFRNVVGPLLGNTLELTKATSICSVVALPEFLRSAQIAQSLVYNPTPLILVALVYLALLWPIARLVSRLERKVAAP
jgi:polar amino acid transport system permease protein